MLSYTPNFASAVAECHFQSAQQLLYMVGKDFDPIMKGLYFVSDTHSFMRRIRFTGVVFLTFTGNSLSI